MTQLWVPCLQSKKSLRSRPQLQSMTANMHSKYSSYPQPPSSCSRIPPCVEQTSLCSPSTVFRVTRVPFTQWFLYLLCVRLLPLDLLHHVHFFPAFELRRLSLSLSLSLSSGTGDRAGPALTPRACAQPRFIGGQIYPGGGLPPPGSAEHSKEKVPRLTVKQTREQNSPKTKAQAVVSEGLWGSGPKACYPLLL